MARSLTRSFYRAAAPFAFVAALLIVGACSSAGMGDTLDAPAMPLDVLATVGEFEIVDMVEAKVDSGTALEGARADDFGRPGTPEVALVRVVETGSSVVPIADGQLVWVFHWGGLAEEDLQGFHGESGKPNQTVFVHSDYFLFVDASDGKAMAGVLK